jgi:hypothetical protein
MGSPERIPETLEQMARPEEPEGVAGPEELEERFQATGDLEAMRASVAREDLAEPERPEQMVPRPENPEEMRDLEGVEAMAERVDWEEREAPQRMARRESPEPMELVERAALEAWVESAAMARTGMPGLREQVL